MTFDDVDSILYLGFIIAKSLCDGVRKGREMLHRRVCEH